MALLPFMSTLVTVHLYSYFRTDQGTDSASGTFAIVIEGSRQVATGIELIGAGDHLLGAEGDADFTSFA